MGHSRNSWMGILRLTERSNRKRSSKFDVSSRAFFLRSHCEWINPIREELPHQAEK